MQTETTLPPDPPAEVRIATPRPSPRPVVTKQDRLRLVEDALGYGDANADKVLHWCRHWEAMKAAFGKPSDPARCEPK